MKEKLTTIALYILLALIVCATGVYWLFTFAFDDILNYYYGGILKYVFIKGNRGNTLKFLGIITFLETTGTC